MGATDFSPFSLTELEYFHVYLAVYTFYLKHYFVLIYILFKFDNGTMISIKSNFVNSKVSFHLLIHGFFIFITDKKTWECFVSP